MPQIPAEFANDEVIIKIKGNVEKMKATAVGQKFTDFEMATPDGKPMKLSDYVGKGKVVLIDSGQAGVVLAVAKCRTW